MNTIKMFWAMITGLFRWRDFSNKDDFWEWYWEQIPDKKYRNETLYEAWETFKFTLTFEYFTLKVIEWKTKRKKRG